MPSTLPQSPEQNEGLDFKELFIKCLHKWYWFVISLAVFLAIGVLKILRTPEVYSRGTEVLIKEERNGRSLDVSSMFSNLGLVQSNVNVNNELIAFQSTDLMKSVVERLHLEVTCYAPGFFHDELLYGRTNPYSISFPDAPDNQACGFTFTCDAEGNLTLQDFTLKGEKIKGATAEGKLGEAISTPVGTVLIARSPYWKTAEEATEEELEAGPLNHEGEELRVSRGSIYGTATAFSKKLTVELADKLATVIRMNFQDVSIQRAEEVLNTLIAIYNENWMRDRNMIAVSTSSFINERLDIIQRELGKVDESISTYKSENLIPDVAASTNLSLNQSAQTRQKILEVNTQLSMARYIRSYMESAASPNQLIPAGTGVDDANIEKQIGEFNTLLLQRNNLASNSSESNPLVVDMDNSLRSMRQAIHTSIDNLIVTLNTQLSTLERSEEELTASVAANPEQARHLLSVEREQAVMQALYTFLLQKREENELSKAFTSYNSRIITPPSGSSIPVAPSSMKILLVMVVLGLALPFGVIYAYASLNTTIHSRRDIQTLTAPFLGEIPLTGSDKRIFGVRLNTLRSIPVIKHFVPEAEEQFQGAKAVVVRDKSRDIVNEAFRVVRTNFEFMVGNDKKVVMFTSINAGSGKSFICTNLAAALAIKGRKVLAIDLDLRRVSLSEVVGSPRIGLASYLAGKTDDLSAIITPVEGTPGLDMLPAGANPPNPTELLFSERLLPLIESMRKKYDYILLDCPPVDIVADASIVAKLADMTIFVMRSGLFDRNDLPDVEKLYSSGTYPNFATMLNAVPSDASYHYGRHYGYGKYGYGRYGYGDSTPPPPSIEDEENN